MHEHEPCLLKPSPNTRQQSDRTVVSLSAAAIVCFLSVLAAGKHKHSPSEPKAKNDAINMMHVRADLREMTKEQAKIELERLVHHCAMHCDFQSASLLSHALTADPLRADAIDAAVNQMNSEEAKIALIQLAELLERYPDLGQQVIPSLHRYFAKQPLSSSIHLISPFVSQQPWCCDPHSVELVTGKFLTKQALRRERRNQKIVLSKE